MRVSARRARLLAATAICTVVSTSAFAQDYGLQSTDSTPVSNPSGTTLYGNRTGILSTGSALNLDNEGTIRGDGTATSVFGPDGGVIISGGPATITNGGSISGGANGISTSYFINPDNSSIGLAIGSSVSNSGSIIGDTDDGIRLIGGGTVTNSGYIAGRVGAGADGISTFAYDGQDTSNLPQIGTVNNLSGGIIEGNRLGIILSGGGTINNAGTINGGLNGALLIQLGLSGAKTGAVNNSGTINGSVFFNQLESASVTNSNIISSTSGPGIDDFAPSGSMSVTNTGTGSIHGSTSGIRSDGTSFSLANSGTIRGDGTLSTPRIAFAGVLITGGPASITNSGGISGAGFGITTGWYSDPQTNAASGRATGSTVSNSGSVIGDGNDGIRLIGGGSVTNSGYVAGRVGAGADGVSMFAFDDQDTSVLPQIGTVNNLLGATIEGNRFGIILSGGGTVSNAGTINGGIGGGVLIQTGFINGKTGLVANSGTINGTVQFNELESASVTNSGAISSAAGPGIYSTAPSGSLAVTNQAGGSIAGSTSGVRSEGTSLSLNNAGIIRGNGTTFTLRAADAGVLVLGGPAAVTNSGTISGAGFGITTGSYSDPVTNAASGRATGSTVSNGGSIIGDTNDGIRLIGGGSVTNTGYVAGRVGAGADGVSMFAFEDQDTSALPQIGTVTNLLGGTIEGNRFGIILSGGGTINNAGTINGGTNGALLIQTGFINGKTGLVANSGTIRGTTSFFELDSASLTNSGTMTDAVLFNSIGTASVVNSGTISGISQQWALFSDGDLSLDNTGTILAPSTLPGNPTLGGIGMVVFGNLDLDNSGTVSTYSDAIAAYGPDSSVNNSGTITSLNGEGVQITGSLVNSGRISGGYAGSVMTGGSASNLAGGSISGGSFGIHFVSGAGTFTNAGSVSVTNSDSAITFDTVSGAGPSSVSNSGSVTGSVQVGGNLSASITNSGSITARGSSVAISSLAPTVLVNSGSISTAGATAVSLGGAGAADTVTLLTGSAISGAVDGGSGSDLLRLSGTIATPTLLQTVGRFLNFETMNVLGGYWTAPSNTGTFASTTVNGGALAVNGTITSPVSVNAGAMLAGTGTITGNTTLNSGSLLSPGGSSLGTLSIAGTVAFNAGSTLSVQTSPNGSSDKLAVTGAVTITRGTTLQILAGIANYAPTTSYLVLSATGGITGKFDTITTDYAYFKATANTQQKGTITVQIMPNGKPLPSAASPATFSTASAVDALGSSSQLYQSVLYQSLTGARQAFDALSGSSYARLDALVASDVGRIELGLDKSAGEPALRWSGLGSLTARGLNSGSIMRSGPVTLMMVGGRYASRLASENLAASVDTRFIASAAAYQSGRFQGLASVTSAWHDVAAARTVSFPGFADHATSRYASESHRVDLEAAYALSRGKVSISPYAGYSRLMLRSKAFSEDGGISSLSFNDEARSIDQLRVGVRMAGIFRLGSLTFSPHTDVSLNRSSGDIAAVRQAEFISGRQGFDSVGSAFDRRMIALDSGIDVKAGPLKFSGSYRARRGNRWRDQSALLRASLQF